MSSYSEYLGRAQQRLRKVQDTRGHRDAGHQTEIVRQLAASGVQETRNPATSGNMVLDGPSTRVNSVYKPGHSVKDTSLYSAYTAGQAVAQSSTLANTKAAQINQVCYSNTVVKEISDALAADSQLSALQAAKTKYQRGWNTSACCQVCGKPPTFKGGCGCSLTVAQRLLYPTSGSRPEVPS